MTERCEATGKIRYPDHATAIAAPQPGDRAHHPHFCDAGCNGWHLATLPEIGHATDRRRARQRAKRLRRRTG